MTTSNARPPRIEMIGIGDIASPVRTVGDGTPVLLLHGIPGDFETLAPVADFLAGDHEATTVSMRYAGLEPPGSRPFGTSQQRDDLRDLLEHLGPVHLVAWSYSAHAALALAAEDPELLTSLLVYEPGFPTFVEDADVLAQVVADTQAGFGPVFAALADGDLDAALELAIDNAAQEPGWFDQQPSAVRQVHRRTAHLLELLTRQTPPIALTQEDLRSISTPTTVAWGDGTRPAYRLVSQAAAQAMGAVRRRVIPSAGHLLPEQDPTAFAREIRAHTAWAIDFRAAKA